MEMDLKIRQELIEHHEVKKEPEELFHDAWFFGNLLQRSNRKNKPETQRSVHSELYTSSADDVLTGKSYEETYESIKKLSGLDQDESTRPVLVKAPSMPCSTEIRKDQNLLTRGRSGLRRSKQSNKETSSSNLVRAPSLPVSLRDHEDFEDDEEMEFSMGRLIRLASMNSSDILPPRTTHAAAAASAKGAALSSRSKAEVESIRSDSSEDITPQQLLQPQKYLGKELQGLKKPGRVQEKNIRRWISKEHNSTAPQIPTIWEGKKSSNETKEQIKFWARSVASNVRQEC